jgi:1-acyl-sn-glycerol-3-phosphate acyltransferase
MTLTQKVFRAVITRILHLLLRALCIIDSQEFLNAIHGNKQIKAFEAPMIIAINHINFLEIPMLVALSYPVYLTGLVKDETWKNPFVGFLMDVYNAIPLNRDGSYVQTFKQVQKIMEKEQVFIAIAPEGTRSTNGILSQGKAGIVQLALLTGVPILPVVHFGGEKIWENMRRLRRTPFHFRVGRPFRFKYEGRPDKKTKQAMLNELMGQIAALLPETMRGAYADQVSKEPEYLEFLEEKLD